MKSLLINLVSTAIWVIAGAVLGKLIHLIAVVRAEKNLWQIADVKELVIVASQATATHTGEYTRPATGVGQIRALASIVQSLNKAYGHFGVKNIYLSTDQLQERLENDLLLLGGPKHSKLAADLLDSIAGCQPLTHINNRFFWRQGSGPPWNDKNAEELRGEVQNNKVVRDYGVVIRALSPFASKKRTVVLIAGDHTYGVVAAAKYFTENVRRDFKRKILRDSNIVVVVSAKIVDQYPVNIQILKYYTWSKNA